jgi:PAS domain S-box-containing protein
MVAKSRFWRGLLDDGLDELARSAHAGFLPRVAVNIAVAGVFAMMVPWRLCLAWGCVTVALEVEAWFATRRQFLGQAVGWRTRLWHLAGLAGSSIAWVTMGGVVWASGGVEGAICAIVVWLALIFFAQTNAYQSRTGFLVGGALPSVAVLGIVLLAPHAPHLRMLPVVVTLALCLSFAVEGVSRMLQARRRLDETQERMRRSEARYRLLADNATDVIALSGQDGEKVYFSPSIEQALGYKPEDLLQTASLSQVHLDDREEVGAKMRELGRTGGELTHQYRCVRSDGRAIWVETSFTVVEQADGRPSLILSVSRNIDGRKELEAQLIEAREAAEAAAAAKSDFLANMTHELRTPLNAIIGFSSLLKDSDALSGQDARYARLIREASGTLLDLVNAVLDFSRLDAGAVELDPAPFDPAAEAGAIMELLEDQAKGKGLTIDLKAHGGGLLYGDAKRVREVLLNFLSNAIKFTAKGGVTVRVSQTPSGDDIDLRIEVKDTGVGLPASQINHIFERFTQADVSVSRRFGGTGLGLAICKRVVELMGGRIGAASVEGEGSTFWLELTLPRAEALGAMAEPEPIEGLDRQLRLLLVEDVAINRELVTAILAPFEIEIHTAENGVEAVEAFRGGVYDLVLMDVQMPVMDGLTATRRIRALPTPAARTTPIVAMTANVLPDQIAKCVEAGMDDHLGKPMQPARLLEAIGRWAGHDRSEADDPHAETAG